LIGKGETIGELNTLLMKKSWSLSTGAPEWICLPGRTPSEVQ
jgi:hypothetical protein